MLTYQPPLRDIQFLMKHVLDANYFLHALPRYADFDIETLDVICEEMGGFAKNRILPTNAMSDSVGCKWEEGRVTMPPGFSDAWFEYRDLGWPSVCAEVIYGGEALPRVVFSAINELVASTSHSFGMISSVNHCASACLRHSANQILKEKWLPKLAKGEVLSSMCMTEPQAGSDLGLLTTRAVREADGTYSISGMKIFASGAEHNLTENIVHLVLARLPDAPPGSRGISLFLIPKLIEDSKPNGVYCDSIEHKMGLHGSPTCNIRFERAQGWLIGYENFGLKALFPMMNEARLLSGLQAIGASEIALQNSQSYALERRQGRLGKSHDACELVKHMDVQRMLMIQRAWTEGGRALVHWSALLIDEAEWHPDLKIRERASDLLGLLTPIIKGFLTENAQQSTSMALQIFGGHGYIKESGIEQLVRDVRVTTIYEGATGIQAQDLLVRKVLSDNGTRLKYLEKLVEDWLENQEKNAPIQAFSIPLRKLLGMFQNITNTLIEKNWNNPGDALIHCSDYLRLIGHLVIAWLWAKMAAAAIDQMDKNIQWYSMKLETAHFYYNKILPETLSLQASLAVQSSDLSNLISNQ